MLDQGIGSEGAHEAVRDHSFESELGPWLRPDVTSNLGPVIASHEHAFDELEGADLMDVKPALHEAALIYRFFFPRSVEL